jgi:hypothetical protein
MAMLRKRVVQLVYMYRKVKCIDDVADVLPTIREMLFEKEYSMMPTKASLLSLVDDESREDAEDRAQQRNDSADDDDD